MATEKFMHLMLPQQEYTLQLFRNLADNIQICTRVNSQNICLKMPHSKESSAILLH